MSSFPTISIALATYNGARFLGEQLESLAKQTLQPIELVVCDDGSTDDTLDVLKRWGRNSSFPVRIHPNPSRLGFADNFLRAGSLCQGDLIAFCDQDDVWLPNKLSRCVERFRSDPELTLVSHNAWVTDESLVKKRLLQPRRRATAYRRCQLRLLDHSFFGFGMVFDGRILRDFPWATRAMDYILDAPMSHDHWAPFLAGALGTVVIDGEPLALYRQHGQNTLGADWDGDTPEYATHARTESVREQLAGLQARLGGWAEFLAALSAKTVAEPDRSRLEAAGERYAEISQCYDSRAALYRQDANAAARLRSLAKMTRTCAYRSPRRGGLGARPLLRDIAVTALGLS